MAPRKLRLLVWAAVELLFITCGTEPTEIGNGNDTPSCPPLDVNLAPLLARPAQAAPWTNTRYASDQRDQPASNPQLAINLPAVALLQAPVPFVAEFRGAALQDDEQVVWISNLVGEFTRGVDVQYAALPEGNHEIHAEVTHNDSVLFSSPTLALSIRKSSTLHAEGMLVLGQVPLPRLSSSGIAVSGQVLAVARYSGSVALDLTQRPPGTGGISLFDLSDPVRPVQIARFGEPNIKDVAAAGSYLFIGDDFGGHSAIYDIKSLANPMLVQQLFVDAHSVFVGGCTLGIGNARPIGGLPLYDLHGLPNAIQQTRAIVANSNDGFIKGNTLYAALTTGFCIYSIEDLSNPRQFGCADRGWTHSVVPSEDDRFVFVTDESAIGQLEVWNIENPGRPDLITSYVEPEEGTIHQPVVIGERLYLAAYHKGVVVLDVSNPRVPNRIALFDPIEGAPDRQFAGVWDIAVARDGTIYASDTESGIWILRLP